MNHFLRTQPNDAAPPDCLVDPRAVRHSPAESPQAVFHLPTQPHPALLSRLRNACCEGYPISVFPAIVISLWQRGLLEIRCSPDCDHADGYLPIDFHIPSWEHPPEIAPYEKAILDIFRLCKTNTFGTKILEETIRTHLTRVQRLLSHCAYSITQALDEAHFLEKVTLPPGPGEHPPLSAKTQTAMYLMLAAFFFAGLAAPAAFFLECIPVYFIFLRKTTAQGRRPTQEAEDLLAQWNGYFSFVDGMCGLYRQQAETISADEWARAIPYLLTSGQWSRWLEEFPLICADTADPSREPPCFVSRFYRRDAAGTLSPIPELPHFFKQFEAACIYVFYADKSGQVDFDFRAFSSYSGS